MIYTEASNVRAVTTRIVQEKIHKKKLTETECHAKLKDSDGWRMREDEDALLTQSMSTTAGRETVPLTLQSGHTKA